MTNNENQSKEYAIPMEVTNETIRDYGIDPSKGYGLRSETERFVLIWYRVPKNSTTST